MLSEEQAIENLKDFKSISILYGNTFTIFLEQLKKYQEATDTVLNLITNLQKENEEKDRKMKKYLDIISKNIIETIKDELVQQKNKELDFKDKQIDLMAELVYKRFKAELLLEYGFENEEQLKQYFADLVEKE